MLMDERIRYDYSFLKKLIIKGIFIFFLRADLPN